jgi:hypothetical protein
MGYRHWKDGCQTRGAAFLPDKRYTTQPQRWCPPDNVAGIARISCVPRKFRAADSRDLKAENLIGVNVGLYESQSGQPCQVSIQLDQPQIGFVDVFHVHPP